MRESHNLPELVALSRRYGSDPAWVLAGGGNSSWKTGGRLFVKASGRSLGTIDPSGFCEIGLAGLELVWKRHYPEGTDEREEAVLADLMAARAPGVTARPSVETLLHGLFPQPWVLHTHPALVNGMTCGRDGKAAFERLFQDSAIWVPFVEPGYLLAKAVKDEAERFQARTGGWPALMFMGNHGLLVAGDSPEEIDRLSRLVAERLSALANRHPDNTAVAVDPLVASRAKDLVLGKAGPGATLLLRADREILARASSAKGFEGIALPFTPDHIVYAGHEFLRVDKVEDLSAAWDGYTRRNGQAPRILLVAGLGAMAVSSLGGEAGKAAAGNAMALFEDACAVAAHAESFGGPSPMAPRMVDFIRNWEVEKYRAKVALDSPPGKEGA